MDVHFFQMTFLNQWHCISKLILKLNSAILQQHNIDILLGKETNIYWAVHPTPSKYIYTWKNRKRIVHEVWDNMQDLHYARMIFRRLFWQWRTETDNIRSVLTSVSSVSHPSDQERDTERDGQREIDKKIVRQPGERKDREVHMWRER